jgi:hypothetical protein
MTRLRILLAAALAVAALAVIAVPASASVPAANAKFCKAADNIGSSSGQPTKDQAKSALKGFKNAAKYAPAKVKAAMNNIAKYLGLVAGADNPTDLAKVYTSDGFKNYAKSITSYVTYYAQQCSGT